MIAMVGVGYTSASCSMTGSGGYALIGCAGSSINGYNQCAYDTNGNNWCVTSQSAPSGVCQANPGPGGQGVDSWYSTPLVGAGCPRCGINCVGNPACSGGSDGCGVCHEYYGPWGVTRKCASS